MFDHIIASEKSSNPIRITAVTEADFKNWLGKQTNGHQAWVKSSGYEGKRGTHLALPGEAGVYQTVVISYVDDGKTQWDFAALPGALPAGEYILTDDVTENDAVCEKAVLGLYLGGYRFDRYRKSDASTAKRALFAIPANEAAKRAENIARGIGLARDLINIPANDMGPEELEAAARRLGEEFGAKVTSIVGEDLNKRNFPAIYTVGKGSDRDPRLIDLRWGDESAPKITLVGKGVCFDTGGYDLKPSSNMLLMKKDMGGSAQVLGLARMIMAAGLPVRLRVLIPAVENMVSGKAYRPSDILQTRKGITVEVGNTDAEGRLVLSDALTEAVAEDPEMLLDFATLTGAARVALGLGLPALFSNNDDLANGLLENGLALNDPMWRLPLWDDYRPMLDSKAADMNNISGSPYGGAIIAALFLDRFAEGAKAWAHIDLMAWNPSARPGRPEGGEAQGIRAAFKLIADRYGK
ncbi:leucyl aminopeptidase family protein [Thalassospira xiamenensis]|uniref:Cytochrome C oxidase subunit II n=1 Tax=Thalassospira xiamenensis TaxID=220697 RepID=A0A367XIN3_9PROT|nr:leucyl aminopeptidase family protein [Thalassospira xiamenensis]KZB52628.1 cytochrome C oxidase subunit II [Thalassospira xiamenensis]MCK2168115.1 leucyl aminopeptidase family protein [Thalassospira xiamenensis]RCK53517.1 cytochrome C oxidase subunit II [Thalassospira xiamenensis]